MSEPGEKIDWSLIPDHPEKSNTPETDAEAGFAVSASGAVNNGVIIQNWQGKYVPADFARKLERERDEARKLARFEIDGALSYLPEDLVIQHDDAFAAMALTFAKLNQEVSKLRAEVERLKAYKVSESLRRRAESELTAATVDGDYCRVNKDYWFMLIAERDEAREERERAETKCAAEYEAHKMTKAERDALRAEVEQLKADKARLDWLEKAKSAEYCEGARGWSVNGWSGPYFARLRAAIYDAMKGKSSQPPTL